MCDIIKLKHQQTVTAPVLTDWDRKFMAYHEAGHAVCSYYLPERDPLVCITIDPSSEAFGIIRTESRPHHNETEISFCSMISTFLAGRISEEMFLQSKTTSCIWDLVSARQIASDMVLKFGMGKRTGLLGLNLERDNFISESFKEKICKDIKDIIDKAEDEARKILKKNEDTVDKMAEKLLRFGTLNQHDIVTFFESIENE